MTTLAEAIRMAMETSSCPPAPDPDAIPTGISGLDHLLTPGTLTVIAGSFGHGADILATNIARVAAIDHGIPTLFTSCRSGRQQMMEHLISAVASVDIDHITAHRVSAEEKARMAQAAGPFEGAPLYINDEHLTVSGVATQADTIGAQLAVIEGAYLLRDEEPYANEAHRAEIHSLALMRLAKQANISVVVSMPLVGSISRSINAAPMLRDFGFCGAYEASADAVILVHRPELAGEIHRAEEIDITVVKRRNGATSRTTARIEVQYDRITDLPALDAP